MSKYILVAYIGITGTTEEIAEYIGDKLREQGARVDVCSIKTVDGLGPYDAVVLGSAVRMNRMLPAMVRFANKHRRELAAKPAAYFVSCFTMKEDTPESRALAASFLKPLCNVHQPVSIGLFAGRVDYARLGGFFRWAFQHSEDPIPEGDWRDWNAIHNWVNETLTTFGMGELEESHA